MWYFPFAVLVILNLADFWATEQLIQEHGYSVEANPLLYSLMVYFNGCWPILVAKLIPLTILGVALFLFRRYITVKEKLVRNVLWGVNIGLCYIVLLGAMLLNRIIITI